jgi:hypothetical protein
MQANPGSLRGIRVQILAFDGFGECEACRGCVARLVVCPRLFSKYIIIKGMVAMPTGRGLARGRPAETFARPLCVF